MAVKTNKNECDLTADENLPVSFHCRGLPASCMDLVHYCHDSYPPDTDLNKKNNKLMSQIELAS